MDELHKKLRALLQNPHETLDVEIKDWLNLDDKISQADLAQAILALANHGGGYILIGFKENLGTFSPTQASEPVKSLYNQDRINGIIKRYADPQVNSDCYNIEGHPVIIVHGGYSVPIRCVHSGPDEKHVRQNAYYIRRPGPTSEEPKTGQEWATLIRRCVLSDKESLIKELRLLFTDQHSQPQGNSSAFHEDWVNTSWSRFEKLNIEHFEQFENSPYKMGYWLGSYSVIPSVEGLDLSSLYNGLAKCIGNETGWPIGLFMQAENSKPYPYNNCVETYLAKMNGNPRNSDFWRASLRGNFFIIRGFEEDSDVDSAGKLFDVLIPIWRVGELLLHASRFVKEFVPTGCSLIVSMKWWGLNGRRLASSTSKYYMPNNRLSRQNEVSSYLVIEDALSIEPNLSSFVENLTGSLYEVFDFFRMPNETISDELNKMRNRK